MTASVVRFFDNNRWRLGVVYATGRKKVSLLDVGRLREVKLPKDDAKFFRPVQGGDQLRLANSLLDHGASLERHGRRYPRAVVERVAAMLRGGLPAAAGDD